jgi:hypothetical protein
VLLLRELLFRRNDRKRRRRDAAESKPVFACHDIQWLNHFVSDADVDSESLGYIRRAASQILEALMDALAPRSGIKCYIGCG